ncbi:uncharacterized protein VTP21DRAFT_10025 [Calcarisporiella thermophila]|uniref:uncharacterized protein n=1 Tax=Calcarisporiella thermophila TaxID=911321 RepID=UPI003742575B
MLGRLLHFAVDATLVSTALAGVKRSTGLSIATEKIENEDVRYALEKFLKFGERTLDVGISFIGNSEYFERKQ